MALAMFWRNRQRELLKETSLPQELNAVDEQLLVQLLLQGRVLAPKRYAQNDVDA
jgi:hypothetical protein